MYRWRRRRWNNHQKQRNMASRRRAVSLPQKWRQEHSLGILTTSRIGIIGRLGVLDIILVENGTVECTDETMVHAWMNDDEAKMKRCNVRAVQVCGCSKSHKLSIALQFSALHHFVSKRCFRLSHFEQTP
jgi:hypothetical protein